MINLIDIRTIRKEKRMTLSELSGLSGLSRQALSNIERGFSNPEFCSVIRIYKALGYDMQLVRVSLGDTASCVTHVHGMPASSEGRGLVMKMVEMAYKTK